MTEVFVVFGIVLTLGGAGSYFVYRLLLGAPFEDPTPFRDRRRQPRD